MTPRLTVVLARPVVLRDSPLLRGEGRTGVDLVTARYLDVYERQGPEMEPVSSV